MIQAFKKPRDLSGNPEIRIVGPRSSGKTAYMAALACWPNADSKSPIKSVEPFDDDTGSLKSMARDILKQGVNLAPTDYYEDPIQQKMYTLLIEMNPTFFQHPIDKVTGRSIRFQVSSREYAGELIEDLLGNSAAGVDLNSYLDDCASALGLLLLVDGTASQDEKYALAFEKLRRELSDRLTGNNRILQDYRIAVVFSKCEQPQVWIHRDNLERFLNLRFPQTKALMNEWHRTWNCQINYFFCSAFGMRGTPPSPNVQVEKRTGEGTIAVIANRNLWRPFGLVAPVYWLHTGHDDSRLRKT